MVDQILRGLASLVPVSSFWLAQEFHKCLDGLELCQPNKHASTYQRRSTSCHRARYFVNEIRILHVCTSVSHSSTDHKPRENSVSRILVHNCPRKALPRPFWLHHT